MVFKNGPELDGEQGGKGLPGRRNRWCVIWGLGYMRVSRKKGGWKEGPGCGRTSVLGMGALAFWNGAST